MKKMIHTSLLIAIVVLSGCTNSWEVAYQIYGVNQNTVLELTKDLYLYCYCGEYQLSWPEAAQFSMEDFKKDPSIGVVDQAFNIAFISIVPKGTKVKVTNVQRPYDWNGGVRNTFVSGVIADPAFAQYTEVSIPAALFPGKEYGLPGGYLRILTEPDATTP